MTRISLFCVWMFYIVVPALPAADPAFPYGAVYFRKSNPPQEDWARDHKVAAQLGMNTFRHWFMWSAIEVAPGKYDWRDYDRMLELAAGTGIKVVIGEMDSAAPEWAFEKYPHARYVGSDGRVLTSGVSPSSATGGYPGLCLDNEDVRAAAERFHTALAEHYRNHPALLGYDIWNEGNFHGGEPERMFCYCEATQQKFRQWLREKYGSLEALRRAWYRYSYVDWENVHPPRDFNGYPESLDWLEFRIDNAFRLYRWRTELYRRLDPKHKITAHGVAGTLDGMASSARNEWRSAAEVDIWGLTWSPSKLGTEPWKLFHAVDLVRAGARGKPIWHAEAQAGYNWLRPMMVGRPREDGRFPDEKDVQLWNLTACAAGVTGIMSPRWRPLLDGPLFGSLGWFANDGSVTSRAEMAGRVARWANSHPEIWKSRPIRGDVGIVVVPESQLFNYVQQRKTNFYAQAARGAYQAFFDSNIQADWVYLDHLHEYALVYLPYPVMLKEATARKLISYVENGGYLVSEGLPAYFGDRGRVGTVQPNFGLDKLFGARESWVEFVPDLADNLKLRVRGWEISGRYFLQEYAPTGGIPAGTSESGRASAVENNYGKGKTLLIGSFPGGGYFLHHSPGTKAFFAGLLESAKIQQHTRSSDPLVQARVHQGPGGTYLWVVNPTRKPREVRVVLSNRFTAFTKGEDLWDNHKVKVDRRSVELVVSDRNVAVIRLN